MAIVSFLWNFFISRKAATAERRYKKERWSENYIHMAAFSTRTCLLSLSPPSPLPPLLTPPTNAITRAASLRAISAPPQRIMDRFWQPRPKSRMASILRSVSMIAEFGQQRWSCTNFRCSDRTLRSCFDSSRPTFYRQRTVSQRKRENAGSPRFRPHYTLA